METSEVYPSATSDEDNKTTTPPLIDLEEPEPHPPTSNGSSSTLPPNGNIASSSQSEVMAESQTSVTSLVDTVNSSPPSQASTDDFISLSNVSWSSNKSGKSSRSTKRKKKRHSKRTPTGYPDVMASDVSDLMRTTPEIMNTPTVATAAPPVVPAANKIEADIMQIDSILKALNTGTFDQSNMASIEQLTEQRPQVREG